MTLRLALKFAKSARFVLIPGSICHRLHETFLWKSTKNYGKFDKSLLIQWIHTFIASFVSWRQHSNIRGDFCLQRCVRHCTLSPELFGVHSISWYKNAHILHANILKILRTFYHSLFIRYIINRLTAFFRCEMCLEKKETMQTPSPFCDIDLSFIYTSM